MQCQISFKFIVFFKFNFESRIKNQITIKYKTDMPYP